MSYVHLSFTCLCLFFFVCAYVNVVYVCSLSVYVCSVQGGQKRASDPLTLELESAVSHHRGAGN